MQTTAEHVLGAIAPRLIGVFIFESVVNKDADASSSLSDSSEEKLFVSVRESRDSNKSNSMRYLPPYCRT